jgi:hypothetical protein
LTPDIHHVRPDEIRPGIRAILEAQGVPRFAPIDERTTRLAEEALALYEGTARPAGILLELEREVFASIFKGNGRNDPASPVGPIFKEAEALALFVATLGEPICDEISQAFRRNDFPLGSMLDATASEAADLMAQRLEEIFRERLNSRGSFGHPLATLRFSPGYCGWDMSGQRSLFEATHPSTIGISLNESFLMRPIKSVSGVIIAGKKEIFQFDDTFSFCRDCLTHTCRDRLSRLMEQ